MLKQNYFHVIDVCDIKYRDNGILRSFVFGPDNKMYKIYLGCKVNKKDQLFQATDYQVLSTTYIKHELRYIHFGQFRGVDEGVVDEVFPKTIEIPQCYLGHALEEIVEHFYSFIGSTRKIPEEVITNLPLTNFEDKHLHNGQIILFIKIFPYILVESFIRVCPSRLC